MPVLLQKNLDILRADGCQLVDPPMIFLTIRKASLGDPCKECKLHSEKKCPAYIKNHSIPVGEKLDREERERNRQTSEERHTFVVGDRVKYCRKFLQNIGEYTGPMSFARGTVKELKKLGDSTIVTIEWDADYLEEVPPRVNAANLVKEKAYEPV